MMWDPESMMSMLVAPFRELTLPSTTFRDESISKTGRSAPGDEVEPDRVVRRIAHAEDPVPA
jgi:hypothetical protein